MGAGLFLKVFWVVGMLTAIGLSLLIRRMFPDPPITMTGSGSMKVFRRPKADLAGRLIMPMVLVVSVLSYIVVPIAVYHADPVVLFHRMPMFTEIVLGLCFAVLLGLSIYLWLPTWADELCVGPDGIRSRTRSRDDSWPWAQILDVGLGKGAPSFVLTLLDGRTRSLGIWEPRIELAKLLISGVPLKQMRAPGTVAFGTRRLGARIAALALVFLGVFIGLPLYTICSQGGSGGAFGMMGMGLFMLGSLGYMVRRQRDRIFWVQMDAVSLRGQGWWWQKTFLLTQIEGIGLVPDGLSQRTPFTAELNMRDGRRFKVAGQAMDPLKLIRAFESFRRGN